MADHHDNDADNEAGETSESTDSRAHASWPKRVFWILAAISVVAAALINIRMASANAAGPPHADLEIDGRIPATLYLPPGGATSSIGRLGPPVGGPRPAVVLAHGYLADRPIMSAIARTLAEAGFVVLTYDSPGHGQNGTRFAPGSEAGVDAMRAAYDWLERSPYARPGQIAVAGHSMGSGIALEFASRDPRPSAVISMSGGWSGAGPRRPKNVLLTVAESDPGRIWESSEETASRLAGVDPVNFDQTYGEFRDGTAVRITENAGRDHVTVLYSDDLTAKSIAWLNQALGVASTGVASTGVASTGAAPLNDPRLPLAVAYLPFLLVLLVAAGLIAAALGKKVEPRDPNGTGSGIAVIAGALVLAAPFVAVGEPGSVIPLSAGNVIIAYLAIVGAILLTLQLLVRRGVLSGIPVRWLGGEAIDFGAAKSMLIPVAFAAGAFYLLMAPLAPAFHNMVPSPKRLIISAATALLLYLANLAIATIVRRGPTWQATLYAVVARILILAAIGVGATVGVFAPVILLALPILALAFVMFEFFSTAAYSAGRNVVLIAAVESVWLGLMLGAMLPVTA